MAAWLVSMECFIHHEGHEAHEVFLKHGFCVLCLMEICIRAKKAPLSNLIRI